MLVGHFLPRVQIPQMPEPFPRPLWFLLRFQWVSLQGLSRSVPRKQGAEPLCRPPPGLCDFSLPESLPGAVRGVLCIYSLLPACFGGHSSTHMPMRLPGYTAARFHGRLSRSPQPGSSVCRPTHARAPVSGCICPPLHLSRVPQPTGLPGTTSRPPCPGPARVWGPDAVCVSVCSQHLSACLDALMCVHPFVCLFVRLREVASLSPRLSSWACLYSADTPVPLSLLPLDIDLNSTPHPYLPLLGPQRDSGAVLCGSLQGY